MTNKGYVQVYTGNGKGKTTAAIGLAVRAACAGLNVYIGQFVKGMKYSELLIEDKFDNITIERFGKDCFIYKDPEQEDIERANRGLKRIEEVLLSNKYDVVVLDEVTIAIYFRLFSSEDLIKIINKRNPSTEVILTGRYADSRIIACADLVTEMVEVKHYYTRGIEARVGIEK